MALISIIIPTYKTNLFLYESLKSIYNSSFKDFEVLIINNNKSIDFSFLKNDFPLIKVINNKKNLGFASACNKGLERAKGKYFLIINPDVIFFKDTLKNMVQLFKENKKINISTCKAISLKNGKLINNFRKFPTIIDLFFRFFFKKNEFQYKLINKPFKIDWAPAFFLFMKKKYKFDERFFLYFEDVDICRRVKGVYYNPFASVFHYSYNQSRKNFFYFLLHINSFFKYLKKWGY